MNQNINITSGVKASGHFDRLFIRNFILIFWLNLVYPQYIDKKQHSPCCSMSLRGTCFRPHFKSQNLSRQCHLNSQCIAPGTITNVIYFFDDLTLYCNCESVINGFPCVNWWKTFFAKSSKNATSELMVPLVLPLSIIFIIHLFADQPWGTWVGFKNGAIFFKHFVQSLITYIKLAGVEIDWGNFSLSLNWSLSDSGWPGAIVWVTLQMGDSWQVCSLVGLEWLSVSDWDKTTEPMNFPSFIHWLIESSQGRSSLIDDWLNRPRTNKSNEYTIWENPFTEWRL